MGGCLEATREKNGGIQMDLQGEACSKRKRGEVQGVLHGVAVARYFSIQTIISLAAEMGWRVHQMDVKAAFPQQSDRGGGVY